MKKPAIRLLVLVRVSKSDSASVQVKDEVTGPLSPDQTVHESGRYSVVVDSQC